MQLSALLGILAGLGSWLNADTVSTCYLNLMSVEVPGFCWQVVKEL